ncbi:MAG: cadherin repeat domain-containing protein, partial [Thiotrichaceae bacterium]|nr:cadherin repeat domain-containing protein [Thiotrichaceae bacterium]
MLNSVKLLLTITFLLTLYGCSPDDDMDIPQNNITSVESFISGVAQKGTFSPNSVITLSQLDNNTLEKTGLSVEIRTNAGANWSTRVNWTGMTEASVTGQYYNECNGVTTTETLELKALSNIENAETLSNINLITHFEYIRIKTLVDQGQTVSIATDQTRQEIKSLLSINIKPSNIDILNLISNNKEHNAIALVFSSAFSCNSTPSLALDKMTTDFSDNGQFDGVASAEFAAIRKKAGETGFLQEVIDNLNTTLATELPSIESVIPSLAEWVIVARPPDNTNPIFTSADSFTATENQTAIGTVIATDNTTVSYSLTAGTDQAKFAIDTSSGVLTFITAPDFEVPTDSNTNNTYQVTVTATDTSGNTVDQAITVTVTD